MLFYMFLAVVLGFVFIFFRLTSPHKDTQDHFREETAQKEVVNYKQYGHPNTDEHFFSGGEAK